MYNTKFHCGPISISQKIFSGGHKILGGALPPMPPAGYGTAYTDNPILECVLYNVHYIINYYNAIELSNAILVKF